MYWIQDLNGGSINIRSVLKCYPTSAREWSFVWAGIFWNWTPLREKLHDLRRVSGHPNVDSKHLLP